MDLSAAMVVLAHAGYVDPRSEHYQTERELVALAIASALAANDPETVRLALAWAGLPTDPDGQLRFAAALGYLIGVMRQDASVTVAWIGQPAPPVEPITHCPDCDQKLSEPARPVASIGACPVWCATCETSRPATPADAPRPDLPSPVPSDPTPPRACPATGKSPPSGQPKRRASRLRPAVRIRSRRGE